MLSCMTASLVLKLPVEDVMKVLKHDEDCTRKSDKQKPMGRLTKRGTLEKRNYVENTAVEQWQIIF